MDGMLSKPAPGGFSNAL